MNRANVPQLVATSLLAMVLTGCATTSEPSSPQPIQEKRWFKKEVVSKTASGKRQLQVEPRLAQPGSALDEALTRPDACVPLETLFRRSLQSRWEPDPEHMIRADDGRVLGFRRRVSVGTVEDGRPTSVSVEQVGVHMLEPDTGMSAMFVFMGVGYDSVVPGPDQLRERIKYDADNARWRWSDSDDSKLKRVLIRASHGGCDRARIEWRPQRDSMPAAGRILDEVEGDTSHRSVEGPSSGPSIEAAGWSDEVEQGAQTVVLQSVDELGRRRGIRVYAGRRLLLARRSAYGLQGLRAVEAIDAASSQGKGRADGRIDEVHTHEFDQDRRVTRMTTRIVGFEASIPIARVPPEMHSVRFEALDHGAFVEPTSRIVSCVAVEAYTGNRRSVMRRTETRGEHGFVYDGDGRLIGETLDGRIEGSRPYAHYYDGLADRTIEHAYDEDGRRTQSAVFEDGWLIRLTTFEYDDQGRRVREHVQRNIQSRSNPNKDARDLRTVRDWTHTYQPDGRKKESRFTTPESGSMEGGRTYRYDQGRLVETRTHYPAQSKSTRRLRYDSDGNLVEEVAYGVPYRPKKYVIRHEYDASGRRVRTHRGQLVLEYEYRGERVDRVVAKRVTTTRFVYECDD